MEGEAPVSKRHLDLRTAIYQFTKSAFADQAIIGSNQFLYFDASDPSKCLAPDLFVRLGGPDTSFTSWKTWQRGAPQLAVEIVSDSDASELAWDAKLARYHAAGIEELVRFDADGEEGERLRVWDQVDADFVERVVYDDLSPCRTLGGAFVVRHDEQFGPMLRLSRDVKGEQLWPTPEEARQAEARARVEAQRQAKIEAERARVEAEAREAAERRVRELEEELRRRG